MTIKYGLTIENEKLITEKAKLKENGIYTFRGVIYRVHNSHVTHYARSGVISEKCYGFLVDIGKYTYESQARLLLKGIV